MGGRGSRPLAEIRGRLSLLDRFATRADALVSRAVYFAFCVLLMLVWAPSFLLLDNIDTSQLIINIVTFLFVALLQNTQKRSDDAIQHKLNADRRRPGRLDGATVPRASRTADRLRGTAGNCGLRSDSFTERCGPTAAGGRGCMELRVLKRGSAFL
uniref:Uncharacterized protein n=1 Tax=Rhodococcus sp. NS1 TaxID=402236 RepID=A0A097SQF9_9NOCA|nr:hypothetical protein LRS1606.316 [Rhodococcus sp. NS1]